LTARVAALASGPGRVLAVLEGGYDLDALRRSVTATAAGLLGIDVRPEPPTAGGPGADAVLNVAMVRAELDAGLR
jgi:acetoin utilization deacetylase AcuC-like enzyme